MDVRSQKSLGAPMVITKAVTTTTNHAFDFQVLPTRIPHAYRITHRRYALTLNSYIGRADCLLERLCRAERWVCGDI